MKRATGAAFGAFRYFSTIPLGAAAGDEAPDGYTVAFLPLVGAAVGAVAGAAGFFTAKVAGDPWPALAAFATGILLTGAIHIDGFLDCCDALFAATSPQRRLEILHDPHHGTFAVAGMVLLAALWLTALHQLQPAQMLVSLAFAAALARACAIPWVWLFPYARGGSQVTQTRGPIVTFAVLGAGVVAAALLLRGGPVIALASLLLSFVAAWACSRRLGGGLTGDTYGAIVVLVEVFAVAAIGFAQ